MLFSNLALESEGQTLCVGRKGPSRCIMSLSCPGDTKLIAGNNYAYNLSFKKPDCPEVVREFSSDVCLLLSAEGLPFPPIPGKIKVLAKHKHLLEYIVCTSNHYEYDWPCAAIKVSKINTIIRVQKMGQHEIFAYLVPGEKNGSLYISPLFKNGKFGNIFDQCKMLKLCDPICTLFPGEDGTVYFDETEWIDI